MEEWNKWLTTIKYSIWSILDVLSLLCFILLILILILSLLFLLLLRHGFLWIMCFLCFIDWRRHVLIILRVFIFKVFFCQKWSSFIYLPLLQLPHLLNLVNLFLKWLFIIFIFDKLLDYINCLCVTYYLLFIIRYRFWSWYQFSSYLCILCFFVFILLILFLLIFLCIILTCTFIWFTLIRTSLSFYLYTIFTIIIPIIVRFAFIIH